MNDLKSDLFLRLSCLRGRRLEKGRSLNEVGGAAYEDFPVFVWLVYFIHKGGK